MTIIDGVEVAIAECDDCRSREFYIVRGQNGEGYKIACVKCHKDQRDLIDEFKLPYLWKHLESRDEKQTIDKRLVDGF